MAETVRDLRDPTQRLAFVKLLDKAEAGDKRAAAEARELLSATPELWDIFHSISQAVEDTLLHAATEKRELTRDAWRRHLRRLREELAGQNPTPLERLLARRAALCWFQLNYFEALYIQGMKDGRSIAVDEFLQRRQDRAHARFLSAVKTLALVRRLAVPALRAAVTNEKANRAGFIEPYEEPQTVRTGGR